MGTLRSASDCTGMTVGKLALGQPTFTDEITPDADPLFAWDDARLPNGVITDDGQIIVDEPEDM